MLAVSALFSDWHAFGGPDTGESEGRWLPRWKELMSGERWEEPDEGGELAEADEAGVSGSDSGIEHDAEH